MNRTVSMVAAGGLLTAAICLPLALLLHGGGASPERWEAFSSDWFHGGTDLDSGPVVSRDFSWDGNDHAELDGAGDLHFHPAPTWHLTVRGPEHTLDRLRVREGHIGVKSIGFFHWDSPGHLDVDLSGPALREVAVNGSGRLTLGDMNQDALDIRIRGSGSAVAHGIVNSVHLEMSGSGSARLEDLAAKEADVRIAGSGDVDIAPTDSANVSISGSGTVRLHSSPRRVTSHVSGSGHILDIAPSQLQ